MLVGKERFIPVLTLVLCALIGTEGFCAIHPSLVEVAFSIRLSNSGGVIEVIDGQLLPAENLASLLFVTGDSAYTGGIQWIQLVAKFTGAAMVDMSSSIGGVFEENQGSFAWDGVGLAGSYTTAAGYTIEVAEAGYFASAPPPASPVVLTEIQVLSLLVSFGLGMFLWRVLIGSYRHRGLTL